MRQKTASPDQITYRGQWLAQTFYRYFQAFFTLSLSPFKNGNAWDNLMMVLLEMLSRAYYTERTAETFEALQPVDQAAVEKLAQAAFAIEPGKR